MNDEIRHICFCTDRNYVPLIEGVIRSIQAHHTSEFQYHLVTDELCATEEKETFDKIATLCKFKVYPFDVQRFSHLASKGHLSHAVYYRLLFPEIIAADRALYLDLDVIVQGSLDSLFEIDLEGSVLAGVQNPFFSRAESLGLKEEWGYFNAGILMMNLDLWRKEDIPDKAVAFLQENREKAEMFDQDALNVVSAGRWVSLPLKYNAQTLMYLRIFDMQLSESDAHDLCNPVIIHFTTNTKPWFWSDMHIFKSTYTQYSDYRPAQKYTVVEFGKLLRNFYRQRIKFYAWRVLRRLGFCK